MFDKIFNAILAFLTRALYGPEVTYKDESMKGRHGSHRQQLPFHQGVAMLAFFVDVPVVVVYQDGPHRLFHRSKVIVDAPMMLPKDGGLTPEALAANTELLQQRMKDLMKELTDGE